MPSEVSPRNRFEIHKAVHSLSTDDMFSLQDSIYYDFLPVIGLEETIKIGKDFSDDYDNRSFDWLMNFIDEILNDRTPEGHKNVIKLLSFLCYYEVTRDIFRPLRDEFFYEVEIEAKDDAPDDWKPITLGHNNPPADKAIEAVEEAIPDIENYRPNEEENINAKEAILSSVQLGLQALKNRIISSYQLMDIRGALTKAKELIIESGKLAKALQAIGALMKFLGLI